MLIRNTNFKPCTPKMSDEIYNGECCCNCRHRYVVQQTAIAMPEIYWEQAAYIHYLLYKTSPASSEERERFFS